MSVGPVVNTGARRTERGERGAILLHVGIALIALIGFLAFVVDYGVMMVSRSQAQNSADGGALAGAIAMAYDVDGWADRTVTGPARTAGRQVALTNQVWGQSPDVLETDVYFTADPADMCPPGLGGLTPCIRVDVYRNQARSNPLPSIFGLAVGIVDQGVRATATARVAVADTTDCLKPWAIPDKWDDIHDETGVIDNEWTADDRFELNEGQNQNGPPLPDPDEYQRAVVGNTGTSFTLTNDLGTQITLKAGSPGDALQPGTFHPIRLPSVANPDPSGGDDYRDSIENCVGLPVGIDDTLVSEQGNMIGPTQQGVSALIAQDQFAKWDPATKTVIDSCATATPSCGASSPRVVAIPVFDTAGFFTSNQNGLPVYTVVQILGFFIEDMQGNDVVGRITVAPGLSVGAGPPFDPDSSFLKVVQLIR